MIHVMSWFSLRMHAGYRCRHAGVCCRANWEIAVETHVLAAVDATRLLSSAAGRALMAGLEHEVELQVPRAGDGTCLFYEPGAGGSCAIHREAGAAALPTACRHFPREIVIDARGTWVSLSHYCPTAAALLATPSALEIVEAGPALVIEAPIDGLDAREVLPPLVRPGLLSDPDGYAAWESAGLAILGREDLTSGEALDLIEALTDRLRQWSPGPESLSAAVTRASTELRPSSGRGARKAGALANDFAALVAQHVPEESFPVADYETRWAPLVEGAADVELVMKNYLGARLFANWIAYQGQGLRTVVEWLRTCHAVIRSEIALGLSSDRRPATAAEAVAAAGRADLLMVHTVDSQRFADFHIEREA